MCIRDRFILGSLVNRWVSIKFAPVVSTVQLSPGAYIDWNSLPAGAEGIKQALLQQSAGLSLSLIHIYKLIINYK